jgi:hypothetical protein
MGAVAEVERRLRELRAGEGDGTPVMRTSVMTHLAWVPPDWVGAARKTLEGLGERHPSRTILLEPEPGKVDGIESSVSLELFPLPGGGPQICSEVIELRLLGKPAKAPASIVTPLLVFDLPVFLRWRGPPPFGEPEFEQLVDLTDRLIVDSGEWPDPAEGYAGLAGYFERAAVSDIAWSRTLPWRRALAKEWPGIGTIDELRVKGPRAEALLLSGWLRSRLRIDLELVHEQFERLEQVADAAPPGDDRTPSDLLSEELEVFGRDPVFEEAVRATIGR